MTPGAAIRPSSTLDLRISMALWAVLGLFTALRWRFAGSAHVPSIVVLLFAAAGSCYSALRLSQEFVDAVLRFFGIGPSKIRCYNCFTIFEVARGVDGEVECPVCHTVQRKTGRPQRGSAFA